MNQRYSLGNKKPRRRPPAGFSHFVGGRYSHITRSRKSTTKKAAADTRSAPTFDGSYPLSLFRSAF
jgi:hypothetical protein